MSFSDYNGSVSSDVPDRPLVVKCTFDRSMKRISFASACNCTFTVLRVKVEQSFSLFASTFSITYKDDDGEITEITNDYDLAEAIHYFQAGDDTPAGSAASVISARSTSSSRKITLRVNITVDYDGPSLSDTSSLASVEEYRNRQIQDDQLSLGGGDSLSGLGYGSVGVRDMDDDVVTVSSRDHPSIAGFSSLSGISSGRVVPNNPSSRSRQPLPTNYRLPGHSVPSVATSPPSPPLSERDNIPPDDQQTELSYPLTGSNPRGITPKQRPLPALPKNDQPLPIFESLRLEEQSRSTPLSAINSGGSSLDQTERGKKWLQEQNARLIQNIVGNPAPSISSGASAVSADDFADRSLPSLSDTSSMRGDLALQKGFTGRFYYAYTTDSASQSDQQSSVQPQSYYSELTSSPVTAESESHEALLSAAAHHLAWLADQQDPPSSSAHSTSSKGSGLRRSNAHRESLPSSTQVQPRSSLPPPPRPPVLQGIVEGEGQSSTMLTDIPAELLPFITPEPESFGPPSEVTSCSACAAPLDSFRYICCICGEKDPDPPKSDTDSATAVAESYSPRDKGKGRALSPFDDEHRVHFPSLQPSPQMTYPPRTISPSTSPSRPFFGNVVEQPQQYTSSLSGSIHSFTSMIKDKAKAFRKVPSRPSLKSGAGSGGTGSSGGGSSSSGSMLFIPDMHHSHSCPLGGRESPNPNTAQSPHSPRSFSAPSIHSHSSQSSSAFEKGYELCSNCIYTVGLTHAAESALLPSSMSSVSSSSSSLGSGMTSTWSLGSSPTISNSAGSPESESGWRRRENSLKGRTRHAFIEKVWSGGAWTAIEQEDKPSCSTCSASLALGRHKCASCENFDLCRQCYSKVHEIHPSHVFLLVPAQKVPPPSQAPIVEEPAAKHNQPPIEDQDDEQSLIHPGIRCHHCELEIVGARFHCAICESVDICQNCESAGLPGNLTTTSDTGHDSSHIMIKIPYPLEQAEVAFASRRARVLWSERDAATIDATTKRVTPRSRSNSIGSSYAATVIPGGKDQMRKRSMNPLDHLIDCDGCDKPIVGVRYQCANCPSDPKSYNLCSSCENLSFIVHPLPHVFLKLNRRVDNPIFTPLPLLPVLYEESETGEYAHLQNDFENLVHKETYCDLCMSPIEGAWFKCVYCNADLCDDHEQLHNENHCCIVLKSQVDFDQLKLIADIENPNNTRALIHPVYDGPT